MSDEDSVRMLSAAELAYLSEMALYEKVVNAAVVISVNQHGIDADGASESHIHKANIDQP